MMLENIKDVAVIVVFSLVVLATIGFFILFSGIRMMKGNKPTSEEEEKKELSPLTELKLTEWEEVDPR